MRLRVLIFNELKSSKLTWVSIEAYGLSSIMPAITGRNPSTGDYNQSMTLDGGFAGTEPFPVPQTPTDFFEYTDGIEYRAGIDSNDLTKVYHQIVIGSGTPAGSYSQVVTYTVTARF